MTQLEKQLTGLMTKDPTIVNENANKDSETFSTMRDLTAVSFQNHTRYNIYYPRMLRWRIKKEKFTSMI